MERLKTYKISDILPYTIAPWFVPTVRRLGLKKGDPDWFKKETERTFAGQSVKMYSDRYRLFKEKGTKCVKCGIEGTYFALERVEKLKNGPRYHFNLYGLDDNGKEMLITKDHIIPKSKGGKNCLDNYQVMCSKCNRLKSNSISTKHNSEVI